MAFTQHDRNGLVYHTADALSAIPGIVHGFSTRLGGVSTGELASLNLRSPSACGDSKANVEENFRRLCAAVGTNVERVVLTHQVHRENIRYVTEEDAGKGLWRLRDYDADALITDKVDLPITVFSADCIILLLCDPVRRAVGAVHAGWRGTSLNITGQTVQAMTSTFGTDPADLVCAIGPGIGSCCFETHDDVPEAMRAAFGQEAEPFLQPKGMRWTVDLKGINRHCLEMAGVPAGQISMSPLCTACHPELYWSHRAMGDARGVQCAMISLQ